MNPPLSPVDPTLFHPGSAYTISSPIRVALVEDQAHLRGDLAHLLALDPQLAVVATLGTGEEAIEQLPRSGAEVVLMDIGLPGVDGVECVRRLKPQLPKTEFMMFTVFEDHDKVMDSLIAGATGYLVKNASWDRLKEAIVELHQGGSPMSSSIARRVLKSWIQAPIEDSSLLEAGLTLREEEVLRSLAQGRRYKEIADDLAISAHTVRAHIHSIYEKLHVRNKAEAVNQYRRRTQGGRSVNEMGGAEELNHRV
jgi:DNA-binding NarL/FixJ family response regulator